MRRSSINIAEAKAHLPELIERAAQGETIILARAGKPRARLVPLEAVDRKTLRIPGKGRGRFAAVVDAAAPLTDEQIALFEGRHR